MATKHALFVQEWNGIMAYKISENDLCHPSFDFFCKALESLFRLLNLNVEKMKENLPDSDGDRAYYIRFCKHVNRLYKLQDTSHNFYFMDLINPTSKKCAHVLKALFNYLKFYQMAKNDVINKANEQLAKYNDVLNKKNDLESKIEKNRKRGEKIERDLRDYNTKLPEMKKEVETLKAQLAKIENEYTSKSDDITKFKKVLSELQNREMALNSQIVNETEYENCLRKIEEAEQELVNLNQAVDHLKTSNMATCRTIDALENILKDINALVEHTDVKQLEETVRLEEKLARLQDEIAAKQTHIKDIGENVALVIAECKNMQEKLKQHESNGKKVDVSAKTKASDLEKQIKSMQEQVKALQIQRTNAEENLHEEEETRECLIKTFNRVLSQIASTFDANY